MNDKDLVVSKKETSILSSNTKTLYLIVTEDPFLSTKQRNYLATRRDLGTAAVDVTGYEVASSKLTQISNSNTVNDAIKLATKNSQIIENLTIPWHRIVRIKNIVLSTK